MCWCVLVVTVVLVCMWVGNWCVGFFVVFLIGVLLCVWVGKWCVCLCVVW